MDPDQTTPMVDDACPGRGAGAPPRGTRGRWCGIAVGALLAAGLAAAPTAAMAVAQPDLCGEATTLTDAGYPQRTLAMVTAAQGKSDVVPCEDARDAALIAVAEAERLARDGDVESALELDAENATALAASRPQTAERFWLGVAEALDSGVALLLAIAAMVLVLATAARWVTTWALPWPTLEPRRSGTAALSGVLLVVVGSSASLALIRSHRGMSSVAVLWFVVALVGVGVLAVGLATRLRIAVVASDAIAGHVIALLGELGARPPEGMEVPRGADVETLGGGALDSLPETALAKAVTALVRTVLGLTPWRVLVDEVAGTGVAVAMTRNGRGVGAVLIEPEVLGLPAVTEEERKQVEKADLYRFVAAFVMVTLQRHHHGFDGLCGARDWKSLGLHYVATTDFMKDEERKKALLVRAVNLDPGNWLAQVALASSRWRESTEAREIGLYLRWLDAAIPRRTRLRVPKYVSTPTWPHMSGDAALAKEGASSLLMRLFLTRAKVAINYYWATGGTDTAVGDEARRWAVVETAVAGLRANLEARRRAPRSQAEGPTVLVDAIEAEALELERLGTMRIDSAGNESLAPERPGPSALALMCPDLRYSEGCTAASRAEWLTLHALRLKADVSTAEEAAKELTEAADRAMQERAQAEASVHEADRARRDQAAKVDEAKNELHRVRDGLMEAESEAKRLRRHVARLEARGDIDATTEATSRLATAKARLNEWKERLEEARSDVDRSSRALAQAEEVGQAATATAALALAAADRAAANAVRGKGEVDAKGAAARTADAPARRARKRAVALLGDAAIDGETRAWMSKDPQLTALRGWKEAKDLRPKPEQNLLVLDLYAVHKKRFDELGIRYPGDLVAFPDRDLALRLDVTRPAARRLIEVARVHEEHPKGTTLGDYRVEILRTILAKGPGVTGAAVIEDVKNRMWLRPDEVKDPTASPQTDLEPPITRWIRRVLP